MTQMEFKGRPRVAEHVKDISLLDKESRGGADPALMSKHNVLTRAKKKHAFLCVQTQRLPEARVLYQTICERDPQDSNAWFMLGTVCGRLGDVTAAEVALRAALNLSPGFPQAQLNLGHALELQGRYAEAEDYYRRALSHKPDLSDAHESLGRVCQHRGDSHGALRHYQHALQLNPTRISARLAAGRLLQRMGRLEQALAHFEHALSAAPADANAAYALGGVYLDLGRADEALRYARLAQQLKPELLAAVALETSALLCKGDAAAALRRLSSVLDHHKTVPELALIYARLCDCSGDFGGAARRLETLLSEVELTEPQRELAHFRLGEIYEAQAQYQRAFQHFEQGNKIKPARFDRARWARRIDGIVESFSAGAIARAPRAGNCSERPVFVVGMPHSGVNLLAQILGAHPEVAGAGENQLMAELALECEMSCASMPGGEGLTQLNRQQCDDFARRYLDKLERAAPVARRVVDAMADNFLHLGLIALLFPLAHVIHCVRDPLDTCLSCYFQDFGGSHDYARDLADLGFYYRHYQRVMLHWKRVLDLPILEVSYEDLVNKPEQVTREVLKFCGLKPDPRGLSFVGKINQEPLTPTRVAPARVPVSQYGIGHWKHYEEHLDALRRALAGE